MPITIKTNNVPRDILSWNDLSAKEQAEFDWIAEDNRDSYYFFRYRKWVYATADFMRVSTGMVENEPKYRDWEGYYNDSYSSAIVVRFADCGERIVVGTCFL